MKWVFVFRLLWYCEVCVVCLVVWPPSQTGDSLCVQTWEFEMWLWRRETSIITHLSSLHSDGDGGRKTAAHVFVIKDFCPLPSVCPALTHRWFSLGLLPQMKVVFFLRMNDLCYCALRPQHKNHTFTSLRWFLSLVSYPVIPGHDHIIYKRKRAKHETWACEYSEQPSVFSCVC